MSARSRLSPWFRTPLTMRDFRLAASIQFGLSLGEELLDSMLARAEFRYRMWWWDREIGPIHAGTLCSNPDVVWNDGASPSASLDEFKVELPAYYRWVDGGLR